MTDPQKSNSVQVEDLGHRYGNNQILDSLSFSMAQGETMAVMGPSGAGKSTLLNCLGGLESIQSGAIHLLGQHLNSLNEDQRSSLRRSHIGVVFQFFHLLPTLTTFENVELPLLVQGVESREREDRTRELIKRVGLDHRMDAFPDTMSGGERQRAAIARALITRPSILLADEPTGNLDESTSNDVLELLSELIHTGNITYIMVTHSQKAASICQRISTLTNGKLIEN